MGFLQSLGWNGFFENQLASYDPGLTPGRVVNEGQNHYRIEVEGANGQPQVVIGAVTGKTVHEAKGREDFPVVGDWVLCKGAGEADRVTIVHTLERKSLVKRKEAGDSGGNQMIASNIDWLLIATSLNDDINFNRLDRYLSLALDAGATPLVLLTKADLATDAEDQLKNAEARFPGVEIFRVSVRDSESVAKLKSRLLPGTTSAIVGSSGVGKSTLINALIGEQKMDTGEIREDDSKGRHTTTSRHLLRLPEGALIIDTPGMREIQLTDDDHGVSAHFSALEALGAQCKFTDCSHTEEPGCKIQAGLKDGTISADEWESYQKLLRETRFQKRKTNRAVAAEDKAKWKKITSAQKQRAKIRGD